MMTKGNLRFFQTGQESGDPRRAYVDIGFERTENGVTTTGDVGSVHPTFAPAIAQVPAMVEIMHKLDQYAEDALEAGLAIPYPGLVEQARAILRAVEGEK